MNSSPASDSPAPRLRGRFEGVLNVVRFNWPLYVVGSAIFCALVLLVLFLPAPSWLRIILAIGACAAVYLVASSLIISYWVYDLSPLYRLSAARFAGKAPGTVVNFHSGFDESSAILRPMFPAASLHIFELHDPARMSEPSIARARRYQEQNAPPWLGELTRRITPPSLPAADCSIDAAFAILSLHEIRIAADRRQLFTEIARILRPGGRLILIEHLRDWPNFLAFGPQFVHFYSRSTWLNLAAGANLSVVDESKMTPFIGVFVFEKSPSAPS